MNLAPEVGLKFDLKLRFVLEWFWTKKAITV